MKDYEWRRRQGDLIRKLRTDRGMTQENLAAAIDVAKNAVCTWETGRLPISPERVVAIAEAFRIELKPFAAFVLFCQAPVLSEIMWPGMAALIEPSSGRRDVPTGLGDPSGSPASDEA